MKYEQRDDTWFPKSAPAGLPPSARRSPRSTDRHVPQPDGEQEKNGEEKEHPPVPHGRGKGKREDGHCQSSEEENQTDSSSYKERRSGRGQESGEETIAHPGCDGEKNTGRGRDDEEGRKYQNGLIGKEWI